MTVRQNALFISEAYHYLQITMRLRFSYCGMDMHMVLPASTDVVENFFEPKYMIEEQTWRI